MPFFSNKYSPLVNSLLLYELGWGVLENLPAYSVRVRSKGVKSSKVYMGCFYTNGESESHCFEEKMPYITDFFPDGLGFHAAP